jgi:hypothetical protein
LENPQAYVAGGRLYVTQQVTPPGEQVLSELMLVDPASAHIRAIRLLGSAFDQALLADRVLWVTTTRGRTSWLWRLDPGSLRVWSRDVLSGSGVNDGTIGTLALAGGWLWVGTSDRLDRISLPSGTVTAQVVVPDAEGVDVAADPPGRVLLDSEGHELAHVQHRDPRTGALIASSGTFEGVTKPFVGGIADGAVWISEAGGMMGAVERLSLLTLRPTGFPGAPPHPGESGPPRIDGANGITARLIAGILWVTQPAGGTQRNYCGAPSTGRPLAPLPLGEEGQLLAADASSIYYVPDASNPTHAALAQAQIDSHCRRARPTRSSISVPNPQQNPRATFECVADHLHLSLGQPVSAKTGEDADVLVLRNTFNRACATEGYPTVTLSSHGQALRFVYRLGGSPYVTANAPRGVVLRPRDRAYALVAKYRCDGGVEHAASRVRIVIPAVAGSLTLALQRPGGGQLDYCLRYPGDQPVDPGNRVTVSPIEPTLAALQ